MEVRYTPSTLYEPPRSKLVCARYFVSMEVYVYVHNVMLPAVVFTISEAVIGPPCEWQ